MIAAGSILSTGAVFPAGHADIAARTAPWPGGPDARPGCLQLRATGLHGWDSVEATVARLEHACPIRGATVSNRHAGFSPRLWLLPAACLRLAGLLLRLGFETHVVYSLKNRFPDGRVTSHAWARTTLLGESRDVDRSSMTRKL
jgi:hypothetical protein